jgi:outer membrane protein OmpA-like peptidoglycan-associated protein
MKTKIPYRRHLGLITPLFCSIAILTSAQADNSPNFHLNADPNRDNQITSGNMEYVGGNTRIGIGMDTDFQGQAEISHIFNESENGTTSGEAWLGYKFKNDSDKGFKGGGVKLNHLWAGKDANGQIDRVHKVFGAYDQNGEDDSKVTAGYGQEMEHIFWSGHVSKGLSGKRKVTTSGAHDIFEKAYDYGVGGEVGTFLKDQNVRIRGGLDYEWGNDQAGNEDRPFQATVSAGVEKFFQDSPHSVAVDVTANTSDGGFNNHNNDVNAKLTYRYEFGGSGVFRSDKQTRRIRVEVPGKPVPPRYENRLVKKQTTKMVKHSTELRSDSLFTKNSAKICGDAAHELRAVAARMKATGYAGNIRISGHTCALGSMKHNQKLSEHRAQAVRNFLVKEGIDPNRMIVRGFGETQPKYPNTPCEGHKNRRVEVEYMTQQMSKKAIGRNEYKRVLVSPGRPGKPQMVWKTETVKTTPAWVSRALHNPIRHKRTVSTYRTAVNNKVADDFITYDGSNGLIDVLANDSTGLTLESVTQPAHGTATIENGKIRYVPDAGFSGTDTFTYTTVDANGVRSTATVTVTVPEGLNKVPVAQDDVASTTSLQPVSIDVLANDSDPDGDTLTITGTTAPANGTVSIVNGEIVYTPNAGFTGTDTFTYTVSDGNGHETTASVTVTVVAPNSAPAAVDDTASTNVGQPVTINVLGNDTDPDGDTLSIISTTSPANGTASIVNGEIVYTPNAGFTGTDTFTYTITDGNGYEVTANVTVTVNAVNAAPTAVDDAVITGKNSPVDIDVVANDTDPDGDTLRVISFNPPAHGSVVDNGVLTYTPDTGYVGVDTFTYVITDGNGHEDTATVTITINDPNAPPTPQDDSATTIDGQPVTIAVLGNDTDPDGDTLTIESVSNPANGTASIVNGEIVYTPNAGFVGTDTFDYIVNDGNGHSVAASVTVTVSAGNVAPTAQNDQSTTNQDTPVTIAVLTNDTDPDGDTLTITATTNPVNGNVSIVNGEIVYTPNAGFVGKDDFTYTISDGNGHEVTASVSVDVLAVNVAPVAVDDSAITNQDQPVAIPVKDNDSDADGDKLTITNMSTPANGSLSIVNGEIIYTPNAGFFGTDSFTYTIDDGHGHTATANVNVTVNQINLPPQLQDNWAAIQGYSPVPIRVLDNDSDPEGDTLTLESVTTPAHGTATISGDQVIYQADAGYTGTDTFTYTVNDGHGNKATATVTVEITSSNSAPVLTSDKSSITEGQSALIPVLDNDSDPDGDTLTITAVATPANGTAVIQGDQVLYTPNAGFTGTDNFTYTVSDGNGHTAQAVISVSVSPAANSDPVIASIPDVNVAENATANIEVMQYVSDPDGDKLNVAVADALYGSVVIQNNVLIYTPTIGSAGTNDTIYFTISDGNGGTASSVININIQ